MKKFVGLITVGACFLLTNCASLSKEECLLNNWQAIGYSDGVAGYSANRISQHQKACARVEVSPNYKAWEKGRKEGLKEYCTTSKAYRLGKAGRSLNDVCPIEITARLERINHQGKVIYKLSQKIRTDKKQLKTYQEEMEKLKNGEMLDFKTEKEARAYLLGLVGKIKILKNEINKAQYLLDKKMLQSNY